MPTTEECKKIISKIAWKCEVSPKRITLDLLSADDKADIMDGSLTYELLEIAVKVWIKNGMPKYAIGDSTPNY